MGCLLNTELTIKIKFNSVALAGSPQTPPFSIEISPALPAVAGAAPPSGPVPAEIVPRAAPEITPAPAPWSAKWQGSAAMPPAPQPLAELTGTGAVAGPDPMDALSAAPAAENLPEPIPLDELEAMLRGELRGGPPEK